MHTTRNTMGTKSWTAFWGLLFVPLCFWAQGQQLRPHQLTLFQDGAQISQKGIVGFQQQKAQVTLNFPCDPSHSDILTNGDLAIDWYRFRKDTVIAREAVASWADVLQANANRPFTVVYEVGADFEEVQGKVRWVNEQSGLLLLQGSDNTDYFIPLSQIQQVLINGRSDYEFEKRVVKDVLEVKLGVDLPEVPMELVGSFRGISWQPVYRIRILGSDKAVLQTHALLDNQLSDFKGVDVAVSPGNLHGVGQVSLDRTDLGKLDLLEGDQLVVQVKEKDLQYSSGFQCTVPWEGIQVGKRRSYSVRGLMRFDVPNSEVLPGSAYTVFDENNLPIANGDFAPMEGSGQILLNLGEEDAIEVSCVEVEVERAKKAERIGDKNLIRVTVDGKLFAHNKGSKFSTLELSRVLKGKIIATGGGSQIIPGTIKWDVSLDPNQKKELRYKFEAFEEVK